MCSSTSTSQQDTTAAARLERLSSGLDEVMLRDRPVLTKRLSGLARRLRDDKPIDRGLGELEAQWQRSNRTLQQRRERSVTLEYPEALPVAERRQDILEALASHQVVVVAGETGSGKTTQLPKLCLELGLGRRGLIGHTQPRRLAARSVAT
ncbi:MAG: ATP-dependent RNA helicase HrpA, partial [Pseudomonadota bacterium]|nr:ATP-dependent RNA helicase HrpA [Pseudomonadota bacterium]